MEWKDRNISTYWHKERNIFTGTDKIWLALWWVYLDNTFLDPFVKARWMTK